MNLRQIEVFRAVMSTGSVTAAARQLHVSQPGISRMLGHIQISTGLRLFERHKARLLPTPEARALHEQIEQVYRGVSRIEACIEDIRGGGQLSLRVLASPSTGLALVPDAVAELSRRYPRAVIALEVVPAREMALRLENHEADLAVSTLPVSHAVLRSRVLGKWTLACVFPCEHPLSKKRSLLPRDILSQRLITFDADTPQGRVLAGWAEASGMPLDASIQVRSGQVACALAERGAGIALVDDLTARACRSELLAWRPIQRSPSFDIGVLSHEDTASSVLARAFVELAGASLKRLRQA